VQAWPTFVLIDPTGRIVGHASGEGNLEVLDAAIAKTLAEARQKGTLAKAPLKINTSGSLEAAGKLAFPGKVLADEAGKRLFIADSNHNRIIVATMPDTSGTARLISVIGSGSEGKADGAFAAASFHNPQGLAIVGTTLYIADTDNHLLRAADLGTSTVKTVSGTGEQGYDRAGGNAGTKQALASPWALEADTARGRLFIAMAGTHQIWTYDLKSGVAKVFAGSGRENIVDGPAMEACLAQPSGLALLGNSLYVADSEVSAIRKVDAQSGAVETVVGRGLFVFGDVDGKGDDVRLQHPLGIAAWGQKLLIADTYNHKIKQVMPEAREVTSLYGTGKPGKDTGGKPAFFEPGGLDVAAGRVFVADTNNHRVVVIDLASGKWSVVNVAGL
jgi:DNA-binding beta-propeller fold protein YncE